MIEGDQLLGQEKQKEQYLDEEQQFANQEEDSQLQHPEETKDDEIHQKDKFFKCFIKEKCLKEIEVTGSKDINKQYTVYILRVKTSYLNYEIERRFKQFKELRRQLVVEDGLKNLPVLQDVFLKRFSQEIKMKRTLELQKFLNELVELIHQNNQIIPFLEFLNVLEHFQELQLDKIIRGEGIKELSSKQQLQGNQINYLTTSSLEKKIFELLTAMQGDSEERKENLKIMMTIIAESPPIINPEFISLLIKGTNGKGSSVGLKGLVSLCGQLDKVLSESEGGKSKGEHFTCKHNLEALNGLLECEKNPGYESFLKEFQEMSFSLLQALMLDSHILSQKPCKIPALKLFVKFIDGLKRVHSPDAWREILQKQKILRYKPQLYEEVDNFLEGKTLTLKRVQSKSVLPSRSSPSSCGKTMTSSHIMSYSYLDSEVEEKYRKLTSIQQTMEDIMGKWETVYSIPEKLIAIQHQFPRRECVRATVYMPLPAADCLSIILNRRKDWDEITLMSKILTEKSQMEVSLFRDQDQQHEVKIAETFDWNSSKRITFYWERKIERQNGVIYIIRTPIEPPESVRASLLEAAERNGSIQLGSCELIVQIKEIPPFLPMNSSQLANKKQINQERPTTAAFLSELGIKESHGGFIDSNEKSSANLFSGLDQFNFESFSSNNNSSGFKFKGDINEREKPEESEEKNLEIEQNKIQQQCEVTFLFNLLNSETVHFFSRYISKGDDETLLQNLVRLNALATQMRKQSSSTNETAASSSFTSGSSTPHKTSDQIA